MTLRVILSLALVGVLTSLSTHAEATPITGEVAFSGAFAATGGSDLASATGISFPNPVSVVSATGDFAPTLGETVTMSAFEFSAPSTPVNPLWSVSGGGKTFSFALDSVSIEFQSANILILSGSGTLTGTGFDTMVGDWNLTANSFGSAFTFSSATVATAPAGHMPEPTSLALFGVGLAVVGFSLRRRA